MSVQPIPYNGPASVDENGVLAEIVQQVADQSPSYDQTKGLYQPKFKGPYSVLKDCSDMGGKWLDDALNVFGLSVTSRFLHPTPPDGFGWMVLGAKVEQIEAGDHAILTLNCEARDNSGSTPQAGTFDPYSDTWQLRWEAYTLKPLAFCSNKPHSDYSFTDPSVTENAHLSGYASREHIETFLNGNDKGVNNKHRWYRDDTGNAWYLNDAENLIVDKTLEDKSALWHYPVLTHTTVNNHYISNVSSVISNNIEYTDVIGDKIDYIVGGTANPKDRPDGCPYTFPSSPKWIWVKTGDDMQHVKTRERVSFQRTETFMGVISADINYYGDVAFDHNNLSGCRWEPGEL